MTQYLYPRLDPVESSRLMGRITHMGIQEVANNLASLRQEANAKITYAALGAPRVTQVHLDDLVRDIKGIATTCGYPNQKSRTGQQQFDMKTSIVLYQQMMAIPGECRRNGIWQYFACVLFPDITLWRWRDTLEDGNIASSRFLGGRNNCFGRLWLRADTFNDKTLEDPWLYVKSLSEDNFQAILDRSHVARYRILCRAIASEYLSRINLVLHLPDSPKERLCRQLMLRIVRASGHTALGLFDRENAKHIVAEIADETLRGMGVEPPPIRATAARLTTNIGQSSDISTMDLIGISQLRAGVAADPLIKNKLLDFKKLNKEERARIIWQLLIGEGSRPLPDLIMLAAESLKRLGKIDESILGQQSILYKRIETAIYTGKRLGIFDSPSRGRFRATLKSANKIPEWLWERLLRSVTAADKPIPRIEVITALKVISRELLGAEIDRRTIVKYLTILQSRGLVQESAGQIIASQLLVSAEPNRPYNES